SAHRPPLPSSLVPYTTLFRAWGGGSARGAATAPSPGSHGTPHRATGTPVGATIDGWAASVGVTGAAGARRWSCARRCPGTCGARSEEHTSELQSRENLVCRLL